VGRLLFKIELVIVLSMVVSPTLEIILFLQKMDADRSGCDP
jgi:hypothetical protein